MLVAEPDHGNISVVGGIHDGLGAGPQTQTVRDVAQAFNRGGDIVGTIFNRSHDEVTGRNNRLAGQGLVPGTHHDLVNATHRRFACTAQPARKPRQRLQLERDMLKNVCRPGAIAQTL